MTDQTVADGANPSAEAKGTEPSAQEALADILKDFDEPTPEQTTTTTDAGASKGDTDAGKIASLEARVQKLTEDTVATRTQEIIREFKGTEFADADDDLVEGFVSTKLAKDSRLRAAWNSPRRGEVMAQLRRQFAQQIAPISKSAAEDNEAIVSAVRGAQTATPAQKEDDQSYAKRVSEMDDAEFLAEKRKHGVTRGVF